MTSLSNRSLQGRHRFSRAIIFVSIWCIIPGFFAFGASAQETMVQLNLATYQNDFLVGEPVVIQTTLTNRGVEGVRYQELSLETGYLKFFINLEGRPSEEYELAYVKDPTRLPSTLAAKTSAATDLLVHYNYKTESLAFPVPGHYTIRAVFRGVISNAPRPLSAEVAINVISPAGEEAEGAALFSRPDTAGVIANISRDPVVFRQMEDYIARHPQARFASYGNYFLGLHHMRGYADKPRDVEKAERAFKQADRERFQIRHSVLVHLGNLSWEQDKTAEAASYVNRVISQYPKTPAAGKASQIKAAIERGPARSPKVNKPSVRKPVSSVLQEEVSTVLTKYFQAYKTRDLPACRALLDESFRYNEALGKEALVAQLSEDFAKIERLNGKFEVRLNIQKVEMLEEKPLAELLVTFLLNDKEISQPKRVSVGLVQKGNRWLLQSWRARSLNDGGQETSVQ